MPSKPTAKRKIARKSSHRTAHSSTVHHEAAKKSFWNWRMLVLGIVLNAATFILVVISVSVLNDYKQCIANPNIAVKPANNGAAQTDASLESTSEIEAENLGDGGAPDTGQIELE